MQASRFDHGGDGAGPGAASDLGRGERAGLSGCETRSTPQPSRLRRFIAWLHMLDGSPEAIGRGIALGLFIAFTPTIGFQLILAAALAPIFRANAAAAAAMVWVTNPFTIGPVFAFTYRVGRLFWGGPPHPRATREIEEAIVELERHEPYEAWDRLTDMLAVGRDVFVPLLVGGIIVGIAAAGVGYVVSVRVIRDHRRRRAA